MKIKQIAVLASFCMLLLGCPHDEGQPSSTTNVKKATAQIKVGTDGFTVEQRNIKNRLESENDPAAIKHLYVVSAFSGQVIIYSTVKGKVTSSGKRLTPYNVATLDGEFIDAAYNGIPIDIGGRSYRTGEVLQDDGTYGSSIDYLFWNDTAGQYHQHYVSGGQIIHITEKPLRVQEIVINMEAVTPEQAP